MFDTYYNDSVVHPANHEPGSAPPEARSVSPADVEESGVAFHLNTRVDRVGDLYVLRAFDAVYNRKKFRVERDTSFSHVGDNFSCWLLAREEGPFSVVVVDDAIINYGMHDPDLRQRYYDQFGYPIMKLFTTIRGCCEVGKQCEAEELCIDMNRFLLPGEIPADQADIPAPSKVVEAFQESNTKLFQDARTGLEARRASVEGSVAAKKWDDLSTEERDFVMRRTAERLGIIST